MLQLGVNIDHVATLRQARYRGMEHGEPSVVEAARICLEAGAHGITAHLREDRRHMQDHDIYALRELVTTRFNLELAVVPEIIDIALQVRPDIVCVVPEKREEVTTEGGLDVAGNLDSIRAATRQLRDAGIEVSLFVDPDARQLEAAARTGCEFVELHTGAYAEQFRVDQRAVKELRDLAHAAELAQQFGLQVNAGHGLNLENLPGLNEVPHLQELNIGHSLVSRALAAGLAVAVREMLDVMAAYRSDG